MKVYLSGRARGLRRLLALAGWPGAESSRAGVVQTRPYFRRSPTNPLMRVAAPTLVGTALLLGSMTPARMAGPGNQFQESHNPASLKTAARGAFQKKLMSAPSISGTHGTAVAQASVNLGELSRRDLSDGIAKGSATPAATAGRAPIIPSAGVPVPPDPSVTTSTITLDEMAASEIPDLSVAFSAPFAVSADSQNVYVQDGETNALRSSTSLSAFFGSLGTMSPFGPKVLYDDFSNHFVIAALDSSQTGNSSVLFGFSDTQDPTATWTLYRFAADPQGLTSAQALSSIGVNNNWIVLSTANYQNGPPNAFDHSGVFALDKNRLLLSKQLLVSYFNDAGYLPCPTKGYDYTYRFVDLYTDWNGNSNGRGFIRHGFISLGDDGQLRYTAAGEFIPYDWTWASSVSGNPNFLPQLGSSTGIYGGDGRMTNAVFRNNTWYTTHSVYEPAGGTPTHMAVHWLSENAVTGAVQAGFFEDPSGVTSYAFPSLAVNRYGDLFIGSGKFSPTSYAGSAYWFRYGGNTPDADFRGPFMLMQGMSSGPVLHIRNGLNYSGGPSAHVEVPDHRVFIADWVNSTPGTWQAVKTVVSPFTYANQTVIRLDNGSVDGAVGAPAGAPIGQYRFGTLFSANLVGGRQVTGMQFNLPAVPNAVLPGDTINAYYGPVSSSLDGGPLTMKPYTVAQRNQLVTLKFDQPIQVPMGQGFFAGLSAPGGKFVVSFDSNLPLSNATRSSPNFGTTYGPDLYNYIIGLLVAPCHVQLYDPDGEYVDDLGFDDGELLVRSDNGCPPVATSDSAWLGIDNILGPDDNGDFIVLYTVMPNPSTVPRTATITVGDATVPFFQAGSNPEPPFNLSPDSTPSGRPGLMVTVKLAFAANSKVRASAAGFTSNSIVAWNGDGRETTMVSSTQLTAQISAADIAKPGTAKVTVFDATSGGGTSSPVTFTITAAPDFSLSLDQPTLTAQAGTKVRVTVNINRTGGFTGNVTATPPDPQGGIKAKPADPITTTDTSATFKLKVSEGTAPGTYHLLIKGVDDSGRERDVTLTLVVTQ